MPCTHEEMGELERQPYISGSLFPYTCIRPKHSLIHLFSGTAYYSLGSCVPGTYPYKQSLIPQTSINSLFCFLFTINIMSASLYVTVYSKLAIRVPERWLKCVVCRCCCLVLCCFVCIFHLMMAQVLSCFLSVFVCPLSVVLAPPWFVPLLLGPADPVRPAAF